MSDTLRHFLTCRGAGMPLTLTLTEELAETDLRHRNTWFEARCDGAGRLIAIDKRVYGDVEMQHRDDHDAEGRLCQATVTIGEDEPVVRTF
ncbi:DUF6156 family protein [Ideonella dechloratans]|uniref:DUF6156 family protein n=1 Tax=Ideonella dechloratans TaxID=36863 RepID=UPI0035B18470